MKRVRHRDKLYKKRKRKRNAITTTLIKWSYETWYKTGT